MWVERGGYTRYKTQARGPIKGKAQATVGVNLEHITALLTELGNKVGSESPISDNMYQGYTGGSALLAQQIVGDISDQAGLSNDDKASLTGFLSAVLMYLDYGKNNSISSEDPKYVFAVMARTDFHSMYNALTAQAHNYASGALQPPDGFLAKKIGARYPLQERVLTTPYNAYNELTQQKSTQQGPTRSQWLSSIIAGDRPSHQDAISKDLLSPPPGFRPHNSPGHDPEGMGAMSIDDLGKVVFELRQIFGGNSVGSDQLLTLGTAICALIYTVEGDQNFNSQRSVNNQPSPAQTPVITTSTLSTDQESDQPFLPSVPTSGPIIPITSRADSGSLLTPVFQPPQNPLPLFQGGHSSAFSPYIPVPPVEEDVDELPDTSPLNNRKRARATSVPKSDVKVARGNDNKSPTPRPSDLSLPSFSLYQGPSSLPPLSSYQVPTPSGLSLPSFSLYQGPPSLSSFSPYQVPRQSGGYSTSFTPYQVPRQSGGYSNSFGSYPGSTSFGGYSTTAFSPGDLVSYSDTSIGGLQVVVKVRQVIGTTIVADERSGSTISLPVSSVRRAPSGREWGDIFE